MAYTIFDVVATATWKPDFMATFKTAVEAEGWVTQENDYNDGTYTRWVFRNGGSDFSIMFFCLTSQRGTASTTTSGLAALYVAVGESYDTTTRELLKVAPLRNMATAADCSIGTTGHTPTSLVTAGTGGPGFAFLSAYNGSTATNPTRFAVNPRANQVDFAGRFGTTLYSSFSVGELDSLVTSPTTNDPVTVYLLGQSNMSPSGTLLAGATVFSITLTTTRSAMNASAAAHSWSLLPQSEASRDAYLAGINSGSQDKYKAGSYVSRLLAARSGSASTFGRLRGVVPNWAVWMGSDLTIEDEVTVGSDTYIYWGGGANSTMNIFKKAV
jgi:hypothetical protein